MRLLSVTLALVAFAGCGGDQKPPATAESEKAQSSDDKKLDCAFARNVGNCWRTATAKLAACLGGKPTSAGKFQKDDATLCKLPEGVALKLLQPCDPDGKCDVRSIMIGKGDKKCGELEINVDKPPSDDNRGAGSLSLATAEGTVKLEWDEKSKKVVCPDGSAYAGTGDWKKELAECDDESGYQGIPGWSTTVTPGDKKKKQPGKLTIEVASMDVLAECEKP